MKTGEKNPMITYLHVCKNKSIRRATLNVKNLPVTLAQGNIHVNEKNNYF